MCNPENPPEHGCQKAVARLVPPSGGATANAAAFGDRFGEVPDLVVEVVSDDPASRIRDYEDKRREYATAGIAEYWIIDATADRVLVLTLESGDYVTAADGRLHEAVASRLFPEFTATIADLLPTG